MSPASSQIEAEGPRRERERRCIVSGEHDSGANLIRFALSPDGVVTPDVAAKLPGRGAWVRADRAVIEQAAKKGAFARAFKAPAQVPEALADTVEALLSRRCLDQLGLAQRAAAIAVGATQVEAAIRAKPLFLLIEATDGAEEGREKLMSLHIGFWGRPPAAVGCFSSSDLGVALGRERVIHACLLQERLASVWAAEIGRLSGFRPTVPDSWPTPWRSIGLGLGGAGPGPSTDQSRGETNDV
ncbi:MAG: RNA-binding protein [Alphaproteobacteria bacterium]|nr:RNA-binding protein [Alphaproteobacteria bacterium]